MKLSIIDQSPVPAGFTPSDALRNTIELARLADRLGYERYWIAEHHATESLASPAPEIVIARVAAETRAIRVGSGGVMLPHYSPLKVAEVFRTLHALYPERIDLGLGRAPGSGPLEAFALRRDRDDKKWREDDFPEQLVELLAFLDRAFPPDHPFSRIQVSPETAGTPEVWLLGSSMWSASAAAQLGLPYAFAHFIDPHHTRAAIEYYRTHFEGRRALAQPLPIVALGALCADTEAEAQRLFASTRLQRRRIRQGDRRPIAPPEQALEELRHGPDPLAEDRGEFPRYAVGTPDQVRDQLNTIASALQLSELMIVTIVHDHRARMRSYELLAEVFGLTGRPAV